MTRTRALSFSLLTLSSTDTRICHSAVMLIAYVPASSAPYYSAYYKSQVGGDIDVYAGRPIMGGQGLGGIFKSGWRLIKPLLGKVGKKVAKRALNAGVGVARDAARGKSVKSALKGRARGMAGQLARDLASGTSGASRKRKRATPSRAGSVKRRRGRQIVI